MASLARAWGFTVLALVTTSPVLAQGTLTLNSIQFVRNATCWSTSPSADLRGASLPLTEDHLFEVGWWFRVAGDSQETAFPVPDTQLYLGDISSNRWNDVGGRGLFAALESAQLFDYSSGSPTGFVGLTLTVTNLSTVNPLTLDIFNMADFDVQPIAANDTATLVEWTPNRILQINDSAGNFAQYVALSNSPITNHYLVRPFGATDVAAVLSDAAVTNFDDSGTPFGPGDFTAGWQFSMTLPPGGLGSASIYLSVNVGSNCYSIIGIFCDGLERGDPSLWSAAVP